MRQDFVWGDLRLDVEFGYLAANVSAPRQRHPQVVLNSADGSVLRAIREELARCEAFTFSVAFVTARGIALLKQELVDFVRDGHEGHIVTSDYLGFNSPTAFAELINLRQLGIDVRVHSSKAFHPKGYVFRRAEGVTAMVGSSNLTENALARNHEWNLMVSAAAGSDLASQFGELVAAEIDGSEPLTQSWVDEYTAGYVPPAARPAVAGPNSQALDEPNVHILPNRMQRVALRAIAGVRDEQQGKAIIISATGTGKTILSALDVRAVNPRRMLFVAHREQILDVTVDAYRAVLGRPEDEFGKLTGSVKQPDRRFVFATIQTLSQTTVLESFAPEAFDYVVIDEAHRTGAATYRRVLDRLRPQFLLGMTATPERTDGFNVFDLFDHNVPYEIRLNHALEEDMLSPFHYYGVAEVTYSDGSTVTAEADISVLISPERVEHLIQALEIYGQAGVAPRGLIFASRNAEAEALSSELNRRTLHGRPLRTIALSGADSVSDREAAVEQLEQGELDYVLTVDIFNEGVDIPSVNQVVMLRQTQSAIVFVQQLGRGLRKARDKEYLVVIDFIGAYANNFMIPIALFGDDSLNKESLRKNMIAAEERGVLPGLSSVRFDRVSQERVLQAIADTKLDSLQRLRQAILAMRNRVGGSPALADFLRFESVDPVLLATARANYPTLLKAVLGAGATLTPDDDRALGLLSHEVMTAKRGHEFVLAPALLAEKRLSRNQIAELFTRAGLPATDAHINSAVDTLTLEGHTEADRTRYRNPIAEVHADGAVSATPAVAASYAKRGEFSAAVDDLIGTGTALVFDRYDRSVPFTQGRQYSRKEVCRILCWPRKWASTLYGYRADQATGFCPIFVTLHKSEEIAASTAYEDALLDRGAMRWFTRSRRTLASPEVRAIIDNTVESHVFVKKDDAEGTDFYYLGPAKARAPEQTTMPDAKGKALDVVHMELAFETPIDLALYNYFHPVVTAPVAT